MEGDSSALAWASELSAPQRQAKPQDHGNENPNQSATPNLPRTGKVCEGCESVSATVYCKACDTRYCGPCFTAPIPHKKSTAGHEPICLNDESEWEDDNISAPKNDLNTSPTHNSHHAGTVNPKSTSYDPRRTLWLYAPRPSNDEGLTLKTSPRFKLLMEQHRREINRECIEGDELPSPRLISFIGNTGAGKSSLIRALIDYEGGSAGGGALDTPPSGKMGALLPMSSDVHLFCNPSNPARAGNGPLMYADCEGLGAPNCSTAGDLLEEHIQNLAAGDEAPEEVKENPQLVKGWARDKFDGIMGFVKRTVSCSDRSDIIREIFPRVLYTISDVIVYVIPNDSLPSSGESLKNLLKWSECGEMSSFNKGFSPSLLFVVNKCKDATKSIGEMASDKKHVLRELNTVVDKDPYFIQRKKLLQERNLQVTNLEEMLDHSFAKTQFISISEDSREGWWPGLELFYQTILSGEPGNNPTSRISLSTEELIHMHELTFEHFSTSQTKPFDFAQALSEVRPPPPTLSGTCKALLETAWTASERKIDLYLPLVRSSLVPMVCSSVAVDCHRRKIKGDLDVNYNGPSYKAIIDNACEGFAQTRLPCGFTRTVETDSGEPLKLSCISNMQSHGNEHRDARHGAFRGKKEEYEYDTDIKNSFHELWNQTVDDTLRHLKELIISDVRHLQRAAIRKLHENDSVNLETLPCCVWCMVNVPTERLCCGHWICPSCIIELGERRSDEDDRLFVFRNCDQHKDNAKGSHDSRLNSPLKFLDIPRSIGRRVLALDDGGVRSIIQLEILQALQRKLGENLSLVDCFDLIGGDGFGGVLALGISLKRSKGFTEVISRALAKKGHWVFNWLPHAWNWGYYRTDDLEGIFRDFFDKDADKSLGKPMFVAGAPGGGPSMRLFVTSNVDGKVMTNYNRPSQPSSEAFKPPKYLTERAERASKVASRTVASQDYYKGGTKEDNLRPPSKVALLEAGALWPRKAKDNVELLVSIGCGHDVRGEKADKSMRLELFDERAKAAPDRYIRLSPLFSKAELPKNDQQSFLREDMSTIRRQLQSGIDHVFRQLVSSSFYVERSQSRTATSRNSDGEVIIEGCIRCRFQNGAEITRSLGFLLIDFPNPKFMVTDDEMKKGHEIAGKEVEEVLRRMNDEGRFRLPKEGLYKLEGLDEDSLSIRFSADWL